MEKKRDIGSLVMGTFATLLFLTLLSTWVVSNMYARYTTEASDGDGARVAAYVFQLKEDSNSAVLNLTDMKKPGDTQNCIFTVTNKNGKMISEVAQSYTIKLEVEGSMPITCEIREQNDTGQETAEPICEVENTEKSNKKENISSEIKLAAGEEYTKTYKITASWPAEYNDEKYASASGTSVVRLTVDAQQLD